MVIYKENDTVVEAYSSSEQRVADNTYSIDKKAPWDVERDIGEGEMDVVSYQEDDDDDELSSHPKSRFARFCDILNGANAETKGIEPITDEEKTDTSLINAASMWFSANMVLPALAIGGLGPMVFDLNFGTSVLVIIFFNILGLLPVAFFSLFGIQLGLRQMTLSRYVVGNIAARVFSFINSVAGVGWGIVNTVAAAQLLNLINQESGHNLPLWAGCLVLIGATLLVSFFGYKVIHSYEKWSWVPNFAVFLVIIARLKKSGNFTGGEWGSGRTTAGNVLSFGCAVFGFAAGWTTIAADYTVYMPRDINKKKVFFSLVAGLSFPLFFVMILGAACGRGGSNNKQWSDLYKSNGMGGLTYAILVPSSLHRFGEFCCVVLSMSTVANNVPNMYSIGLSLQATWGPLNKVPRVIWTILGSLFALAIAIPACYHFSTFMNSFMDSIGYYLAIYISIGLTEHFYFKKGDFSSYNVEYWNKWDKLPVGIAGTVALVIGAFGVAFGMSQTYWVGQIARPIGKFGGDIGFELAAAWAFITYMILRPIERKYYGR
ncbi:cytosine permease KNAG_0L01480 [Huiozyma naganishii CBS 8797]|uniref:Purine-cytosine permease n=1 Tax=Huiozyma naganishii (strain ATCC MYA-139 / BCRC 22969 / CBS 8797 / KCTC 17520 / NBRC 10181 / NCYC 3082 / Yp74L-3) TaxID=1071383 RepID=J7RS86_HUIN7|nr:hypothetical protein KNAG_0L01480 [Kazachstania naganishii CBS 8797]CCK72768.1 hypothetical protein KNAG_0L01480 [Kazachstania naganishii CBS 8797]